MASRPEIILLGTCDTKLEELLFVKHKLQEVDQKFIVRLLDVGRDASSHSEVDISPHSNSHEPGSSEDRNDVIKARASFATALLQDLHSKSRVHGAIAVGGSGGTSIAATAMRALPIGLPKLIVSTMASGDVSSFVGEVDITMMYSVVDVAGLNPILCTILSNAANAMGGMVKGYLSKLQAEASVASTLPIPSASKSRPAVGITMFGITTPAATSIRRFLEDRGCITYTFHATGAGGRAMERLIQEKHIDAVVDLTTTELADHLFGGVLTAGPDRLTAASRAGIPQIISVGALDCVNFGPKNTVPDRHRGRRILEHNPSVTLLRTNADECRLLGEEICRKLSENVKDPRLVEVYLPLRGISMISVEGGPFHDPEAEDALFGAIRDGLKQTGIAVKREEVDINDERFAVRLATRVLEMVSEKEREDSQ